jgi:hypothetical protein
MTDEITAPTHTFRVLRHDKVWVRDDAAGTFGIFHVGAESVDCLQGAADLLEHVCGWLEDNELPEPPPVPKAKPPKVAPPIPEAEEGVELPACTVRVLRGGLPESTGFWLRPTLDPTHAGTFSFTPPATLTQLSGDSSLLPLALAWLIEQMPEVDFASEPEIIEPEPEPEAVEEEPEDDGDGGDDGDTDADAPAPISITSARDIECDRCGAQPGEPCTTPSGREKDDFHADRRNDFAVLAQ